MPLKIYEYCEEIIKSKIKGLITKDTKTNKNTLLNKSIINYKEKVIILKFDSEVMNVIYEIHFVIGNLNNFKDWLSVCWIGRHINNTDEDFNYLVIGVERLKVMKRNQKKYLKKYFYQQNQYD
jgi:hypothetical protein